MNPAAGVTVTTPLGLMLAVPCVAGIAVNGALVAFEEMLAPMPKVSESPGVGDTTGTWNKATWF